MSFDNPAGNSNPSPQAHKATRPQSPHKTTWPIRACKVLLLYHKPYLPLESLDLSFSLCLSAASLPLIAQHAPRSHAAPPLPSRSPSLVLAPSPPPCRDHLPVCAEGCSTVVRRGVAASPQLGRHVRCHLATADFCVVGHRTRTRRCGLPVCLAVNRRARPRRCRPLVGSRSVVLAGEGNMSDILPSPAREPKRASSSY
ncbi:hypothetical protein DAI22_04g086850 [Oryza sativa Japonica Group]|nr:hypothetical protein DAI22_04g086850 [Oryza sativa Japonica Group]